MSTTSLLRLAVAAALATATLGCPGPPPVPIPRDTPEFVDAGTNTTVISGLTYDPEALWYTYNACGPACADLPFGLAETPLLARALVQNSNVKILTNGVEVGAGSTGPMGSFDIVGVPTSLTSSSFMRASGGTPVMYFGPPLPAAPPTTYVTTNVYRPMVTSRTSSCVLQYATAIGENGILDALARYRTSKGMTTTVANLLDKTKFAGVVIWWVYAPGPLFFLRPAPGATIQATAGTVYHLDWEMPGGGAGPLVSPRGFVVVDGPSSPIGLVAVVLPATATAQQTFTAVDTVTDEMMGRPWQLEPIKPPVVPGQVTFGAVHFLPPFPVNPNPPGTCEEQ